MVAPGRCPRACCSLMLAAHSCVAAHNLDPRRASQATDPRAKGISRRTRAAISWTNGKPNTIT